MCMSGGLFYLLCGTGWQQLDIVLFVAWDMAGEKYGIPLGVVGDKSNKILNFIHLSTCFGRGLVFPCCLVVSPEAKKLAFRFMKRSLPVVWHLLLCYVLTVYCVLSNYYLFHAASGM